MTSTMTVSETLNLAADLIEERGWLTARTADVDPWGGGIEGSGPVCLEGGILAALGLGLQGGLPPEGFIACPSYRAVQTYLYGDDDRTLVFHWNDREGRTATEVIETLRAAAVIEAARETETAPAEVTA